MIGIGIDIIEIERIENAIKKFGDQFMNKIFTKNEIEHCLKFKNNIEKFAGKFAAKEAVSKAFGTGIGKVIFWKDIEILHKPSGQPYVNLYNNAEKIFKQFNANQILISITDIKNFAVAVALLT